MKREWMVAAALALALGLGGWALWSPVARRYGPAKARITLAPSGACLYATAENTGTRVLHGLTVITGTDGDSRLAAQVGNLPPGERTTFLLDHTGRELKSLQVFAQSDTGQLEPIPFEQTVSGAAAAR